MNSILSKREMGLLLAGIVLLLLAIVGPAIPQPQHLNDFADRRLLWNVPFAMDVLSNLGFALAGAAGLWLLASSPSDGATGAERSMTSLFFFGLMATAGASGWYHLRPDDAGLAIDRFGMSVAFAGLLGLAAANRISGRSGLAAGMAVLVLAPASVQAWSVTGNVLPWAVMQYGGMGLILWLAALPARAGALEIRWGLVILAYVAAKLLEANDQTIYQLTGDLVSGHTLKHVAAAAAALPVMSAVHERDKAAHNAAFERKTVVGRSASQI